MHTDRQIERQTDMHRCIHWYIYIVRCSTELAQLFPLSYSRGSSTCYFDRLLDFSVIIPTCSITMATVSFFAMLEYFASRMLYFDL